VVALGLVLGASSVDLARTTAQAAGPGLGKAQAALVVIDPRSAQLSFGVRFGPTAADHRNQVARATAQSIDYGLIGGSLTGEGCSGGDPFFTPDQLPQVMRADSREPEDVAERTLQEGPITQSVVADAKPFARSTSRLAELELPGVVRVAGAVNRSSSGVDDEGNAIATAEVEVGQLSLLGGLIQLRGLRWTAVHGGGEEPVGSFTISGASIAGVPLPTQEAASTIAVVNGLVAEVGLVLAPPVAHLEQDVLFVDPLRVGIAPNALRDQGTAALLATIQPLREQLFDALIAASCDATAAILVIDLLLGSVSGGGSFTFAVGGAQATTSTADTFDGLGLGGAPPVVGREPAPAPRPTVAPPPVSVPTIGAPPTTLGTVVDTTRPVETDDVSDGALAVGIATVLLGVVLVEGDRRKMRRAVIPSDASGPVAMEAT
jgi:hypothetical protein